MIGTSTCLRLAAGVALMAGTVALVGCGPDPVTRTTTTTERTMIMPPPPVSTTTTRDVLPDANAPTSQT